MINNKEQYPIIAAYSNNRIEKLKSSLLGLAIATPALVIIVMEILEQIL